MTFASTTDILVVMTKTEIKIEEYVARIEFHQHHIHQLEQKLKELTKYQNVIRDWVKNAEELPRVWHSVEDLHEMFMGFMDYQLSKNKFGRLLAESELFKKRNGKRGREWKLLG